ncbi:MAG: tol-pal system protein YbgF [Desulfovibrionales bacterium]
MHTHSVTLYMCFGVFLLSSCAGTGRDQENQIQELQSRSVEYQQELEQSQQEITRMHSQVKSLEDRLRELEDRAEEPVATPDSTPVQAPDPTPILPREVSEVPQSKGSAASKAPKTVPVSRDRQARAEYQRALDLLMKREQPREAREAFRKFLLRHPGHALEPNGFYWLGESFYLQKQFPNAILVFKEVPQRFAHHPKAPDALLKIGYAYQGLGDMENARFYLETLVSEYPASEAAKKAEASLRKMGS